MVCVRLGVDTVPSQGYGVKGRSGRLSEAGERERIQRWALNSDGRSHERQGPGLWGGSWGCGLILMNRWGGGHEFLIPDAVTWAHSLTKCQMPPGYPLRRPRPKHIPGSCSSENPQEVVAPEDWGEEGTWDTEPVAIAGSGCKGAWKEDFLGEDMALGPESLAFPKLLWAHSSSPATGGGRTAPP